MWTFEYVPLPGHISVETMTLTEREGRTLLVVRDQFSSKEDLVADTVIGLDGMTDFLLRREKIPCYKQSSQAARGGRAEQLRPLW